LLSEIERGLVTEFIKTSSHGTVPSYLDKASAFTDVSYIAKTKVSLVKSDIRAILEDLIALIAH
jgi:hypothetical protein